MKPIQFYQKKTDWIWLSMKATASTTSVTEQLRQIKQSQFLPPKNKRKIAELLYEYYSILFNPAYINYFRPMTDLTLLFPTAETIYISSSTNFILLPLPLPTYEERTNKWQYLYNCPIIDYAHDWNIVVANEFVHDLDYWADNKAREVWIKYNNSWKNLNKFYPHATYTNHKCKVDLTNRPLINTWRIRSYKFQDVPKYIAEEIPTYPTYSMWQVPDYVHFWDYSPIYRKYTFLEIPDTHLWVSLREYSKKMFSVEQLTPQFCKMFKLTNSPAWEEAIIRYFQKEAVPMCEFDITQIKSGIRRLNWILKYTKPKAERSQIYLEQKNLTTDQPQYQSQHVKFNQNVRYWKYKWADWERHEFQDIDPRDFKYKSKEQLQNLYPNQWD